MTKKKQSPEATMQIVFRVPRQMYEDAQMAARGLSLDLSSLLRMLIAEHLSAYIERGKKAALLLEQARKEAQQEPPTPEETQSASAKTKRSMGPKHRVIDLS